MKKFDLMSGGVTGLEAYLKQLKEKLIEAEPIITKEIADQLLNTIKSEAQTIDYNYEAYTAVSLNNIVNQTGSKATVSNTSQQATYSEMGTGLVGSLNPHPDPRMDWVYDVNEHGESGWIYSLGGRFYHTTGLPSNPVYYRSAKLVKRDIGKITKSVLERLLNHESS